MEAKIQLLEKRIMSLLQSFIDTNRVNVSRVEQIYVKTSINIPLKVFGSQYIKETKQDNQYWLRSPMSEGEEP
jgi:hypothetical protein